MLSFNPVRLSYIIILWLGIAFVNETNAQKLQGWETNTEKLLINLDELKQGGPPKDGNPSIDEPKFVSISDAASWISNQEPVTSVEYEGEDRAYPLQILIWHEIVNDDIGGNPLLVTFCPLCYSALVFDRTVDGEVLLIEGISRISMAIKYLTQSTWSHAAIFYRQGRISNGGLCCF